MPNSNEKQTTLTDPERSRHRLEIFNQLFRGLLLVDGGGIVALLAYLQSLQGSSGLKIVVLVGILLLSISLALSLLFMKYRYQTSEEDQFRTGKAISFKKKERFCLNASIASLFLAILVVVVGSFCSL